MSQKNNVQKKALEKSAEERQSFEKKESLRADFEFVMLVIKFLSECITEEGEIDIQDLLGIDCSQFPPIHHEIIMNFQRYVLIEKFGSDDMVSAKYDKESLN